MGIPEVIMQNSVRMCHTNQVWHKFTNPTSRFGVSRTAGPHAASQIPAALQWDWPDVL